jgi:DNA (cytosine-5)-methyltransferase 1
VFENLGHALDNEGKMDELKIIDLFAGVGGLSLGFEQAGFEILIANEYDQSIAEAYIKNRANSNMVVEDITKLAIPETFGAYKGQAGLVIGGPPCQGYSQKGQRKTIHDPRNFLFKYFVEVVKEVDPQYFVMENVPNLLTAQKGYFKQELEKLFSELGYTINAQVLCAADYGVPQNRHRAFIIGKRGTCKVNMPKIIEKRTTIWEAISDLAYLKSGEGTEAADYKKAPETEYQQRMRLGSGKLYNHVATNHSAVALERLAMIPPKGGKEFLPPEHITKSIYSGTWERMDEDDISVTITTRFDTPSSGKFTHPYLDRAITVREAARIQSFPDSFHFFGTKTSQMKQVGNAVPPLLAKAVAKAIFEDWQGAPCYV